VNKFKLKTSKLYANDCFEFSASPISPFYLGRILADHEKRPVAGSLLLAAV
jgi:hypothetical protein